MNSLGNSKMAKQIRQPQVTYPTDVVFAAASYADRINDGEYIKTGLNYENGTPQQTNRQLMDQALADQTLLTQADRDAGEIVRRYYHTLTFKILKGIKLNEFDNNAMLIANKEVIQGNYDIAVTTSLPSCHRRAVQRDQANAKVDFARGGLIGEVGSKVKLTVEVVRCVFSHHFGVFFVTGITAEDQPVFFAFKKQVNMGDKMVVQGTVKAHRDNTTQLNRVKVV
jgi:hypothetical protein